MIRAAAKTETLSPKGFSPYHCHRDIEIDFFESGSGSYSILGIEHPISAGDTFIFTNNILHRITSIDESEPMKLLKIHFDPDRLWNTEKVSAPIGENAYRDFQNIFYSSKASSDLSRIIPASSPYSKMIGDNMRKMVIEYEEKNYKYESVLEGCLFGILIYIARFTRDNNSFSDPFLSGTNYNAICLVTDHINAHLSENLSLDDLASIANMSKNNLLLQFRKFTGTSPYRFIQSRRISLAINMLTDTNDSITNIAFRCGFNNTVSFNKSFKSITGKTPSEFRRSNDE